jgi:hypothetical protein
MSLKAPYMGEGYVPAYQISATPFVTSSVVNLGQTVEIGFGNIANFVIVKNTLAGSTLSVGFTENGLKTANSNYFNLAGDESFSANFRVDRIFLSGSSGNPTYTVVAGLTGIPTTQLLPVTASNGYRGVG